MRSGILLMLALAALLLLPAASAHNTYYSPDNKYRVVVGQLNEPVITYSKTGLDVCFTTNTTARDPITFDTGGITATLVAPDGKVLTQPLKGQFGRAGCYQFQDAYVLTKPGQYKVNLAGSLNGSPVDLKDMIAGGVVGDETTLTFPDAGVSSRQTLVTENAALTDRVNSLESRLKVLEGASSKGAPSLAALGTMVAVLGAAMVASRKW